MSTEKLRQLIADTDRQLLTEPLLLMSLVRLLLGRHTAPLLTYQVVTLSPSYRQERNADLPELQEFLKDLRTSLLESGDNATGGSVALYLLGLAATEAPEVVEREFNIIQQIGTNSLRARHFAIVLYSFCLYRQVDDCVRLFRLYRSMQRERRTINYYSAYHLHPITTKSLLQVFDEMNRADGVLPDVGSFTTLRPPSDTDLDDAACEDWQPRQEPLRPSLCSRSQGMVDGDLWSFTTPCVCMCAFVHACVRASVRAWTCLCAFACACMRVKLYSFRFMVPRT